MAFQFTSSIPLPKNSNQRRTLSSAGTTLAEQDLSRNSSLWAEDYIDASTRTLVEENLDESPYLGTITPPPLAATPSHPFPRSIARSDDEDHYPARQPRTHQRSLTALLPTFRPSHSRHTSTSPERRKEDVDADFMATLTGDRSGVIKVEDRNKGGLSSWFSGSSAPVAVGVPVSTREDQPQTASSSEATPASTSRFNFFSSSSSPRQAKQQTIRLPHEMLASDTLLTLSIPTALYPAGPPSPNAAFSPSAYKNLHLNAVGTLEKLHTAYKLRTLSVHELSAENEAQAEELEEAETRAQCLRTQLEEMARRVQDQDRAVEELVLQLAHEKEARAKEADAREKSIALIKSSRERAEGVSPPPDGEGQREKRASCCSHTHSEEDLGIRFAGSSLGAHPPSPSPSPAGQAGVKKHSWRISTGSSTGSEEMESDSEGAESVFSRSMSPGVASSAASTLTTESTPEVLQARFGRVVDGPGQARTARQSQSQTSSPSAMLAAGTGRRATQRPKMEQRPSTFQRLMGGISSGSNPHLGSQLGYGDGDDAGFLGEGCANCRGQASSVAWDTVGLLRVENRGLKGRVGELEGAVEGALGLCAGLGR